MSYVALNILVADTCTHFYWTYTLHIDPYVLYLMSSHKKSDGLRGKKLVSEAQLYHHGGLLSPPCGVPGSLSLPMTVPGALFGGKKESVPGGFMILLQGH